MRWVLIVSVWSAAAVVAAAHANKAQTYRVPHTITVSSTLNAFSAVGIRLRRIASDDPRVVFLSREEHESELTVSVYATVTLAKGIVTGLRGDWKEQAATALRVANVVVVFQPKITLRPAPFTPPMTAAIGKLKTLV